MNNKGVPHIHSVAENLWTRDAWQKRRPLWNTLPSNHLLPRNVSLLQTRRHHSFALHLIDQQDLIFVIFFQVQKNILLQHGLTVCCPGSWQMTIIQSLLWVPSFFPFPHSFITYRLVHLVSPILPWAFIYSSNPPHTLFVALLERLFQDITVFVQ